MRRIEAIEIALTLGAILCAAILLPNQWGLLHVQPHPLWILAIGFGLRYGAPSGHVAATLAALSYVALLETQPGARFEVPAPPDLLYPFAMLVGGAIVAEAVANGKRRQAELQAALTASAEQAREVSDELRALEQVKHQLEERILGHSQSVVRLSTIGRKLQTDDVLQLERAIVEIVAECLGAHACALHRVVRGDLYLATAIPQHRLPSEEIPHVARGLIAQVLTTGTVACIRDRLLDWAPDLLQQAPAMMAGPLLDRLGSIRAVVVVEEMPFLRLTPAAIHEFELLLEWASIAYRNASPLEPEAEVETLDEPAVLVGSGVA
ncbi:MAG: hypothetical protein GEU73_08800 [Chloroflexi bacterium]|nr:hypothetical protein [Chloroflexota bacterium]